MHVYLSGVVLRIAWYYVFGMVSSIRKSPVLRIVYSVLLLGFARKINISELGAHQAGHSSLVRDKSAKC